MGAMTSEDLARPVVDTPPSRRIKTPEQLAYEIDQIDSSDFQLSPAGHARRKELADELAEQSSVLAVNRAEILRALEGAEAVESISTAAIACLTEYVRLRQELLLARAPYDRAWQQARDLGIAVSPRIRLAPAGRLMNEVVRLNNVPWYR
jgi:hypothetical protein